jgi:hypothetical protein
VGEVTYKPDAPAKGLRRSVSLMNQHKPTEKRRWSCI